jgi:hypothetical protein
MPSLLKAGPQHRLCEGCYLHKQSRQRLGSGKYWRILRDKLISQDYRCAYTGELLVLGVNDLLDHIYPAMRFPERAKDPTNLEWVSRKINEMKRDRTPEEFLTLIAGILDYRRSLRAVSNR